jgi:hypothetical protein
LVFSTAAQLPNAEIRELLKHNHSARPFGFFKKKGFASFRAASYCCHAIEMQILSFKLIACALVVPVAIASADTEHESTSRQIEWSIGQTVQTSSGPVNGHGAPVKSDVSEYLGIPYAQPPVGTLRWQPPVNYTETATINGTDFVSMGQWPRQAGLH